MVVVAACAEPPVEHGDRAVHYDSIGELVASANAVAIGRVAETSRGRVLDQEDVVFTIMDVRVVVERLLAGRMSTGEFTIEQPGWEKTARRPGWRGWFDTAGERPWRMQDELRLTEGDRAVFFLAGGRPPTGWELLGPEGLYLIDDAELADTVRSDPTVRTVEAMTLTELQAGIAAAVAAVERGELKPNVPPTRETNDHGNDRSAGGEARTISTSRSPSNGSWIIGLVRSSWSTGDCDARTKFDGGLRSQGSLETDLIACWWPYDQHDEQLRRRYPHLLTRCHAKT